MAQTIREVMTTDRDIVVRARSGAGEVGEISSQDLEALSPDDGVERAVQAMRDRHVRRIPVEGGHPGSSRSATSRSRETSARR